MFSQEGTMSTTAPNGNPLVLREGLFVSSVLDDLQGAVQAELDQLDARRAEIIRSLEVLDGERNRCKRVLHAIAPQVKTKVKPKSQTKHSMPGAPIIDQIEQGIAKLAEQGITEFTVKEVWTAIGATGKSTWHTTFQALREVGYLGKAGMRSPENGGGRQSQMWTVLEPDALEKLRNG